jgi:hypothetical protein
MKTVLEEKKDIKNSFYSNELGPHLTKSIISKEISLNYNKITNNLAKPFTNNATDIMVSLLFRDKDKIKTSWKQVPEQLTTVINTKNLIKKMSSEGQVLISIIAETPKF